MAQAMTSSVLDGGVGVACDPCESPAPPAFSPLTDADVDTGSRDALDNDNDDKNDEGFDEKRGSNSTSTNSSSSSDSVADPASGTAGSSASPSTSNHSNNAASAAPADSLASVDTKEQSQAQQNALSLAQSNGDPMVLDVPMADTTMPTTTIDTPMGGTMDYTTSPIATNQFDVYQQKLLMALASLSASAQPPQPSTVHPSQVSLPPQSMLSTPDPLMPLADDTAANPPMPDDAPLESFARIEFADSVFQMTTYAVTIGRDQRALEQARRDERRWEEYQRKCAEAEKLGLPPPSPPTRDRSKFSKSYVSEEGGMLGPESDGENPRPVKRRKMSASVSGDSHQQPDPALGDQGEEKNPSLNRQYVSHTPGAAAVNLSALRPSPHYVPFIGIHSPGPNIASRTKAISREHLRIQYNQKEGVFEAIPLHKNGFFCQDVHYRDQKVVLRSGDRLQIKDVEFVFKINGVPRGMTGAEECLREARTSKSRRYSEGGKEMSFDFESTHDNDRRSTSPEDNVPEQPTIKDDSSSELSEPGEEIPEPEPETTTKEENIMQSIEKDEAPPPMSEEERKQQQIQQHTQELAKQLDLPPEVLADLPPIPKKRGPGRPPKNGIMSKREERLRKKAALELAKKNMPQPPPGEPPVKRKVGRPRKHPLPENAPDKPEKRKYKPRKSKEDGEGTDGEKPEKRRREKPKTPPLELRREDYTEEQLQKPNKNYGMLIDEVLSAAPQGLTLKQIYKRIQMKYPFYYFAVDTKGWESSVRHNLIGNDAFEKNEETHLWRRVPGIDIDAGKKRKQATPDQSHLHNLNQQHQQQQQQQNFAASATPAAQFQAQGTAQQAYRPGTVPQQQTGYAASQGQPAQYAQPQQPQQMGVQQPVGAAQAQPPRSYPTTAQVPAAQTTYAPAGQPQPAAAQPYTSPYTPRPTGGAAQPAQGTAPAANRSGVPAQYTPTQYNGVPQGATTATTAVGARPAQPSANANNTLNLKPAVAPELVRHVTTFKNTVTEQLTKRTPNAEAVAMSVINRGLGLTNESMVPNEESLEKIVLGVFESSRKKLGINQSLHPGLVQALVNFKNTMTKTLEPRMGKLNAERLILSAVDRVLGFADKSTMPGSEADKKQYDEAENVLIPAIRRVVTDHQRTLATVAAAAPGAPRPAVPGSATPAPAAPRVQAPAPAPVNTYSPAPNASRPVQMPATAYTTAATPRPPVATAAPAQVPAQAPVQTAAPVNRVSQPAPIQQAPMTTGNVVQQPQAQMAPATQAPATVPNQTVAPVSQPGQLPANPAASQPAQIATTQSISQQVQAQGVKPVQPAPVQSTMPQAQTTASVQAQVQMQAPTQAQSSVPVQTTATQAPTAQMTAVPTPVEAPTQAPGTQISTAPAPAAQAPTPAAPAPVAQPAPAQILSAPVATMGVPNPPAAAPAPTNSPASAPAPNKLQMPTPNTTPSAPGDVEPVFQAPAVSAAPGTALAAATASSAVPAAPAATQTPAQPTPVPSTPATSAPTITVAEQKTTSPAVAAPLAEASAPKVTEPAVQTPAQAPAAPQAQNQPTQAPTASPPAPTPVPAPVQQNTTEPAAPVAKDVSVFAAPIATVAPEQTTTPSAELVTATTASAAAPATQ